MRWSFPFARMFGIQLRVHITFFLLLVWVASAHASAGGWTGAAESVAVVLLIFGCVIFHELSHALAARRYGIRTPDITLLPIGGVAHLERIPERPREELVVAIAGPLGSGVLALLFWVASGFVPPSLPQESDQFASWSALTSHLCSINLGLLLFNLIPAFPMDGGRILRALLSHQIDRSRATTIAVRLGQVMAVGLGLLGIWIPAPVLLAIAAFVYLSASQEAAATSIRSLSRGLRVSDAMITSFQSLNQWASLGEVATLLQHSSQHDFPFVSPLGEFLGLLTRKSLISGLHEAGPEGLAFTFAQRDLPCLLPSHLFSQAFTVMQQCGTATLPVLDEKNHLVGLFSQEKLGELLLIESARKSHRPPGF